MSKPPILVCDADATIRALMCDVLTEQGHTVVSITAPSACVVQQHAPALIILELPLIHPGAVLEHIDAIRQVQTCHETPIIVTTTGAPARSDLAAKLHARGCTVLEKPFEIDYLVSSIARALDMPAPADAADVAQPLRRRAAARPLCRSARQRS